MACAAWTCYLTQMQTKFIEATNVDAGGMNWGKFMVARFTESEWQRRSEVGGQSMLAERGWTKDDLLVLDLQTGEGAVFKPGGYAKGDLDKHAGLGLPPVRAIFRMALRAGLGRYREAARLGQDQKPCVRTLWLPTTRTGATEETGGAGEARQEEREGRVRAISSARSWRTFGTRFPWPDAGHRPR